MKDLVKKHISITSEVKNAIQSVQIVFPSEYSRLYSELAHQHDIELKPNELISHEMLDKKIVRHIITISECTNEAIHAIEDEDKALLKAILIKVKHLQEEVSELQKIIYEDALTKCYNRKWLEDNVINSDRVHTRISGTLAMIDLNKFKQINDTYGHIVGDQVLSLVAKKLRETGGKVIRYGGDEFIALFDKKYDCAGVQAKMELTLAYFNKISIKAGGQSFKIDFAYGISTFECNDAIALVIDAADQAMYKNKNP